MLRESAGTLEAMVHAVGPKPWLRPRRGTMCGEDAKQILHLGI